MKKLILTTLLVIGYLVIAVAQKDTINVYCTTVIAVNGLNIRSQPNTSAEILGKVPYGHSIQYLSKYSFGADTIYDYPKLNWQMESYGYKIEDFKLIGKWAKVNYNGITGYVMDAYLFYDKQSNKPLREDTRKYALMYPGITCYTYIYAPTKYNWYGLFSKSDGSYEIKKVKINYFSSHNDWLGGKDLGISIGNDKGLILIIGSKSNMKEGLRQCVDLRKLREGGTNLFDISKLEPYGIECPSKSKYDHLYHIKNAEKGKYITEGLEEKIALFSGDVKFIGDIDGDNQWDYILQTDEKHGYNILYLSSEKKGKNPVGPVAFYLFSICC